ncbi:MAG: sigma-70 family RNA polymerase sigma factor [Chitinophagia bacterium]|nr:sigma-70 family RNA polymerase sigma factor [Chitinophagia bacterium]
MKQQSKYQQWCDEDLLNAYQAKGNSELLGELLLRHTVLMLGVAMKYLKNEASAEDAVQQVFEKAIPKLATLKVDNLKGWLYILMRNHCLQQLRGAMQAVSEEILTNLPATDSEQIWSSEQNLNLLQEALTQLNKEQQICITLFYIDQKCYNEITNLTGFSFSQVKSYIQNGKRNLKNILQHKINLYP